MGCFALDSCLIDGCDIFEWWDVLMYNCVAESPGGIAWLSGSIAAVRFLFD